MEVLKVSSTSQPKAVAGAIAAILRNGEPVEIQAIGAGAVNQAVKSIAVARGYVAPNGIDLVTIPAFFQLEVNGETKTSIKFIIEKRQVLLLPKNNDMLKDLLKYEVAQELGLLDKIKQGGWKALTARENGMIGANVRCRIKKM